MITEEDNSQLKDRILETELRDKGLWGILEEYEKYKNEYEFLTRKSKFTIQEMKDAFDKLFHSDNQEVKKEE